MPRTKITKTRVNITIDKEILKHIKRHDLKLSRLINAYLSSLFINPKCCYSSVVERYIGNELEIRERSLEVREPKINLREIYFEHKSVYFNWLDKYCKSYKTGVSSGIDKLMSKCDIYEPTDILKAIEKYKLDLQYTFKGIRSFLNYLEENDIISEKVIERYRKKIKINFKPKIDSFVPTKQHIDKVLQDFNSYNKDYAILYKLLLESGCRVNELTHFIENFDKKNIEEWDDQIVLYRNFYIRGNKSSYYLFFTKKTFDQLNLKRIKSSYLEKMKGYIKRNDLTPLKYTRKYHFTRMIENGIEFNIAEWIQGRSSSNVSMNHYLAKKSIAIKEYKKLL